MRILRKRQVDLVPPHGGKLLPILVSDKTEKSRILDRAEGLKSVVLNSKSESDVIMLATGAYSPLTGFMGSDDYLGVINDLRLSDGLLWPIPVTLPVAKHIAGALEPGEEISLVSLDSNQIMAVMTISEIYSYNKEVEAEKVFATTDLTHPGVVKLYEQGDIYLAGSLKVLSEGGYPETFHEFARPADTRALFEEKGWSTIAAFQTRNPIHRSHEYLTKVALELCDGLLIHPVVGKLKEGDIPADIRMECYQVMMENYYNPARTALKVYPIEMMYAGPREAILHAIIRQNFGCSHMIIGRDHAGVGDFYGAFEAQEIFETLKPDDLYLTPINMDWTFWCYKCESIVSAKTCPHDQNDHLMISGTKLREMLDKGHRPPREFSRPEVIDILINYYKELI
ncbi:MAG: sulfate adenylyltransferase [Candidatus Marinimicrobia bacterium]|jgi:sulfate adenylyltransferase|nr:sulfate adenylyltransferase [Candidatus Neomarinimicrobiota bacterium]MBT3576570.1 sulfate adenylyltransferase [Candidatus Neomarinimicrobiota bacterium]MBT3680176.1 sulfate adenylyltransferase [Candidatus Neomarinimicrobiota bacterium]MBT3949823.1 sulfate adenylyltransferase [Candidatus Neomarinimicrobiota bacterium]MBT4253545.1 sulfate adenylyltransferase [Candidatus Neomarinimicrobiota bacterium]